MLSNGSKNKLISENAVIFNLPVSNLLATVVTLVAGRGLFFRAAFYLQDFRVIS